MPQTVESLVRELLRFPLDATCVAYEGEVVGVTVSEAGSGEQIGYVPCADGHYERLVVAETGEPWSDSAVFRERETDVLNRVLDSLHPPLETRISFEPDPVHGGSTAANESAFAPKRTGGIVWVVEEPVGPRRWDRWSTCSICWTRDGAERIAEQIAGARVTDWLVGGCPGDEDAGGERERQ